MENTITRLMVLEARERTNTFDVETRSDYSGREMYGGTCLAAVGSLTDLAQFLVGLTIMLREELGDEEGEKRAVELAGNARFDSMGTDTVMYFPRWRLVDDWEG